MALVSSAVKAQNNMPSARIFHYTTVDSLALILKSGNIRFTRLDRVDDMREAQNHLGIQFGQYFFVSCWTREAVESIPQWNMYSREMQGVRIELPEYPFQSVSMRPPEDSGIEAVGDALGPLPYTALFGPKHFIVPIFINRENFAADVEYVEDVEAVYKSTVRKSSKNSTHSTLQIDSPSKLSRTKSAEWKFQKEYRFSLFIVPNQPNYRSNQKPSLFGEFMSSGFHQSIDPGVDFIDVPLEPSALKNLVVRSGPLCPLGSQVCVEALVSRFAPEAIVESSVLSGAIRQKR
jgi:Protein of unknown function (DUF2971)